MARNAFEIPARSFAMLGISPALAAQAYPLNGRIFMGFLICAVGSSCTFAYVIYDAGIYAEYVQPIYVGSVAILCAFCLLITILKVEKLFKYINGCDDHFNMSEFKINTQMFAITDRMQIIFNR